MKRNYERPMFYAETYTFNESVAANPSCGIDIDTIKSPLSVGAAGYDSSDRHDPKGTMLCPAPGDGGHRWEPTKNNTSATIVTKCHDTRPVITLFNDGDLAGGCEYDYDARKNIIAQTGDNFANSLFANNAGQAQHSPAWNGLTFRS